MLCRICEELENTLRAAKIPDVAAGWLGLSEAGERNRIQQKTEKVMMLEIKLAKHKKICSQHSRIS